MEKHSLEIRLSCCILVGVEIKEKFRFHKSWDKFEFPLPFSKILIDFEKIEIMQNDDRDYINAKSLAIEVLLNNINKIIEKYPYYIRGYTPLLSINKIDIDGDDNYEALPI
jgi:hypothetical protein